jgi:hypothetical protein
MERFLGRQPSAEAMDWPTNAPIVYPLRPTRYEVVVPEELEDWEEAQAAALGLEKSVVNRLRASGTGTWSFSPIGGGYDTFDDSDYIRG